MQRVELQPFTLDGFHRRRERKQRNKRIRAGVVALVVTVLGTGALLRPFPSGVVPADDPRSPFLGSWVSTDADGSTQTMTIRASATTPSRSRCTTTSRRGARALASTMTGSGRIEDGTALVIPAPVYTCDAGSQAENANTPPLDETLRDWTLVLDPEADTLSDSVGGVWAREGTEAPSPAPAASGQMWPQSSLDEVMRGPGARRRRRPRLHLAGRPGAGLPTPTSIPGIPRSSSDSSGRSSAGRSSAASERWGVRRATWRSSTTSVMLIRCAPGRTNPFVYPDMPSDVRGCAPTIDDFRYETVRFDLGTAGAPRPFRDLGRDRWEMLQPGEPSLGLRSPLSRLRPAAGRAGRPALRRRSHRAPAGVPRSAGGWCGGRASTCTATAEGCRRPTRRCRSCTPRPAGLPTSDTRSSVCKAPCGPPAGSSSGSACSPRTGPRSSSPSSPSAKRTAASGSCMGPRRQRPPDDRGRAADARAVQLPRRRGDLRRGPAWS